MIKECVFLAMQALIDHQLGRELSQYDADLVRAVQSFPVVEMSLARERMVDEFARCWCECERVLCSYQDEDNYKEGTMRIELGM